MATYKVTAPDGRVVTLTGDTPPSEQELNDVFSKIGSSQPSTNTSSSNAIDANSILNDFVSRSVLAGNPALSALKTTTDFMKLLPREEAAIAQPLLDIQAGNTSNLVGSFVKGVKGETESQFKEGEQAQLGDLLRNAGAGETASSVGGLLASAALPSSIVGGKLIEGVLQTEKQVAKKLPTVANDFVNTFKKLASEAGGSKTLASEAIESLTNIPSDKILYAFENPNILTKEMARPEVPSELANELSSKIETAFKSNPNLFRPNPEIPYEIAKDITGKFQSMISDAGNEVAKAKQIISKSNLEPKITTFEIDQYFRKGMEQFFDSKGKIKPIYKDNSTVKALEAMREKLDLIGTKTSSKSLRRLDFQDALDLKKSISDLAFKHGTVDMNGVRKVLPEVERVLRGVYSGINNSVKREYKNMPKVLEAFDNFSKLADVRSDLSNQMRNPEKLASFLRKFDSKNPEQLQQLSDLVSELPNPRKYFNSISGYLKAKNESIASTFPFIEEGGNSMRSGFESIMKKDFSSISDIQKQALDKLDGILGTKISDKYVSHKVAEAFSGKTNFFRALAAGSIAGGGALAFGGPLAGLLSLGAGMSLTDPRIQGALIRNFPKEAVTASKQFVDNAISKSPSQLKSALVRRGLLNLNIVRGEENV